jgi:hypothetical protein
MHESSLKGNMVNLYIKCKRATIINIVIFDMKFCFFTTADYSSAYPVMSTTKQWTFVYTGDTSHMCGSNADAKSKNVTNLLLPTCEKF